MFNCDVQILAFVYHIESGGPDDGSSRIHCAIPHVSHIDIKRNSDCEAMSVTSIFVFSSTPLTTLVIVFHAHDASAALLSLLQLLSGLF